MANLLANFQINTPDGSRIIVSTKPDELATCISVSDDGLGISFEPGKECLKVFIEAITLASEAGAREPGLAYKSLPQ